MHPSLLAHDTERDAIPIWFVDPDTLAAVIDDLPALQRAFAEAHGFKAAAGAHLVLPGDAGNAIGGVLFGLGAADDPARDPFLPGRLSSLLPNAAYRFANAPDDEELAVLAWALGSYSFARYKGDAPKPPRLALPEHVHIEVVSRIVAGMTLARDLINTPANDMGPAELEHAARHLADSCGAEIRVLKGDDLIAHGLPMIHAVGRASARAPRLIDLTWGSNSDPIVTLVGKGVCFDTGGLDLKPPSNMLLMKKDMGGAAAALGLASMIMDAGLKVRLRVLVPAVENSVSGAAFRPGDVLQSRKGLTVEIGNTDAEGRLVLADALTLADEDEPDLLVDFATLTGAARIAMGTDLPPFFTDDDEFAAALGTASKTVFDPIWRLPLWKRYQTLLKSKVASVNNSGSDRFGGAITAALFMARFVENAKTWCHFDIYGWVPTARPGQPEGGEAQAIRAAFDVISNRYGR